MGSGSVPLETIERWWRLCQDRIGEGKKKAFCSFLVEKHRSNPNIAAIRPGEIVRSVWDSHYPSNGGTPIFHTTKTQIRNRLLQIYLTSLKEPIPALDISQRNVFSYMVAELINDGSRRIMREDRWSGKVQELWNELLKRLEPLCSNPAFLGRADNATIKLFTEISRHIGRGVHSSAIARDLAWLHRLMSRPSGNREVDIREDVRPKPVRTVQGVPVLPSVPARITVTIGLGKAKEKKLFCDAVSNLELEMQLHFLLRRGRKWAPQDIAALIGEPVGIALAALASSDQQMRAAILSAAHPARHKP
jgi:hypothetical protein